MKAYDDTSKQALEIAVEILGGSPEVIEVVQHVYNLGRTDGRIEKGKEAIAAFTRMEAA